ncbi:uncharacterized protein G2W53_015442 [Senna tora]|uniref:Uncharacterized protein n=1 Tax=Senna tora TaxID=362788 RepID=A0A834WVB8_9FABA|nr:uncharacterized protein G2W53_015442 [Senna tora]
MLKASENAEEEDIIASKHQSQKHHTLFGNYSFGNLSLNIIELDDNVAWSQKEALWRTPQGMMHKTMGKQDGLHKETSDLGAPVEAGREQERGSTY